MVRTLITSVIILKMLSKILKETNNIIIANDFDEYQNDDETMSRINAQSTH